MTAGADGEGTEPMYNRVITIDTTHPAATLTELVVGRFSALMLYIKGVPAAMAAVKFVITDGDDGVEFVGDRETAAGGMEAGLWSVYVRGGYQAEVGSRHYEVRLFDEGGVLYWSGHGILKTIENATSVAPADVGPTGPTGPTGVGEKGDSGVWVGDDAPPEGAIGYYPDYPNPTDGRGTKPLGSDTDTDKNTDADIDADHRKNRSVPTDNNAEEPEKVSTGRNAAASDAAPAEARPLAEWSKVLRILGKECPLLVGYLGDSKAYISGDYLLIDYRNEQFLKLISQPLYRNQIKKAAADVTGKAFKLGPYKKAAVVHILIAFSTVVQSTESRGYFYRRINHGIQTRKLHPCVEYIGKGLIFARDKVH